MTKAPIKNGYWYIKVISSVIDITFISDIVSPIVAISTCNKVMTDVENTLNNDDFFGDTIDTPREDIVQHRKRECWKSVIGRGKAYLLGSKWTKEKLDKASDKTINKTYVEHKQRELNKKGEKTGKALGKHVINLCSTRISRVIKIRDAKKLRQSIENDPIIKDQMAKLGCLFVCIFGKFPAPVLVAAHTVKTQILAIALKMRVIKVIKMIFCVCCPTQKNCLPCASFCAVTSRYIFTLTRSKELNKMSDLLKKCILVYHREDVRCLPAHSTLFCSRTS